MKVYLVFRHQDIDGVDFRTIQIFEHQRDAVAYAYALRSREGFDENYESIEVVAKKII